MDSPLMHFSVAYRAVHMTDVSPLQSRYVVASLEDIDRYGGIAPIVRRILAVSEYGDGDMAEWIRLEGRGAIVPTLPPVVQDGMRAARANIVRSANAALSATTPDQAQEAYANTLGSVRALMRCAGVEY